MILCELYISITEEEVSVSEVAVEDVAVTTIEEVKKEIIAEPFEKNVEEEV